MGASEAEVRPQTILIDKEGANKLLELLKLPGSEEVVEYALEKMQSIKTDYPGLYSAFEALKIDNDLAGTHRDEIWRGERAQTLFQQFQSALLDKAKEALQGVLNGKSVQMQYAMNDDAEFLRGYFVDGKLLNAGNKNDKEVIDNLDTLFNATLARNNLISKDGAIFKSDEYGHVEKVGKKEQNADSNVIETDIKSDMASVLKDLGSNFETARREFPQKAAEKPVAVAPAQEKPAAEKPAQPTAGKGPSEEEGPTPG